MESGKGAAKILSLCVQTALMLVSVFHTGISSVKADVRCFCNLPACITSNYMCKSALGVCVSDNLRRACLELLPPLQTTPLSSTLPPCPPEAPLLNGGRSCCTEDLCNHFQQEESKQEDVHNLNHSYMTGYLSNADQLSRGGGRPGAPPGALFRAAVVAAPVAGGFALVLLVVTAARVLRADAAKRTQLVYHSRLAIPKSASAALAQQVGLHRAFASVGSVIGREGVNGLYRSVSIAVSTDTELSRDKYFVFDL